MHYQDADKALGPPVSLRSSGLCKRLALPEAAGAGHSVGPSSCPAFAVC